MIEAQRGQMQRQAGLRPMSKVMQNNNEEKCSFKGLRFHLIHFPSREFELLGILWTPWSTERMTALGRIYRKRERERIKSVPFEVEPLLEEIFSLSLRRIYRVREKIKQLEIKEPNQGEDFRENQTLEMVARRFFGK